MMGDAHAIIGAAVGATIAHTHGLPTPELFGLAVLGGAVALLPDIDHPRSTVRQVVGLPGHLALFWLPHRGFTHTLLAANLFALAVLHVVPGLPGLVAVAAYCSHLVADLITKTGLPLYWPIYRRNVKLPRALSIRTGGRVEVLIECMAAVSIYWVSS